MVVCIYLVIPNDNKCFLLTEKKKSFPKETGSAHFRTSIWSMAWCEEALLKIKKTKIFTAWALFFLPVLHSWPVYPAWHTQRYPLGVKPVWQVALLSQGVLTQGF